MYDMTVRPGMTTSEVKTLEQKALAEGRGTTPDAPLRVLFEEGVHDLVTNSCRLTAPYRFLDARGAMFKGTGVPKGNGTFWALSEAIRVHCYGGEVVGADVASLSDKPTASEQVLQDMVFRDYAASTDGLGSASREGDTLKASTRVGTPTKDAPWRTHLKNCQFIDWAGRVTTHNIYAHGRYAELIVEDSLFAGGYDSSALKSTRSVNHIRRSKFYAESKMLKGELPDSTRSYSKFVDVVSCSDAIVSDCEFHGALHGTKGGVTHMINFRDRRSLWGTDDPPAADIRYERNTQGTFKPFSFRFADSRLPVSSLSAVVTLNGVPVGTPPKPLSGDDWLVTLLPTDVPESGVYMVGIERADGIKRPAYGKIRMTVYRDSTHLLASSFAVATPDALGRYADAAYWANLGDLTDPQNPHTIKKWISGCKFVRYHNPIFPAHWRGECWAVLDEGTYPVTDVRQFSVNNFVHPVPPTWQDRSTTFFYEDCVTEGWLESEYLANKVVGAEGVACIRSKWGDLPWGEGGFFFPEPGPSPRIVRVVPERVVTEKRPDWFRT